MITLRKKYIDCFNFIFNKKVILRTDLNLPKYEGKFTDLTRLEKIIPTIKDLLKNKAKIIIISHFGRPKGKENKQYSLEPIAKEIEKKIDTKVFFIDDDIRKTKPEKIIKKFKNIEIILLENIRFYEEEENNDITFAKNISSLGDIFINECFSASHRSHSSIIGIPQFLPSFPGKLLENEVKNLKKIISKDTSDNNNIAIIGGAKISTKIHIIEFLLKNFKYLLIGGAMANTFLAAKGKNIGGSFYEKSMIKTAKNILDLSEEKIILPIDVIVQKNNSDNDEVKNIGDLILKNESILDIGPKTRINFAEKVSSSDKLLWNGPLGMFEKKPFDSGTKFVVQSVINKKDKNFFSVAGGGDTISMLKQFNAFDGFSYVSTGGGAFLEFIQGKDLPGLVFLNK